MNKPFYRRVPYGVMRPKGMAVAYYDWVKDEEIMVLVPFHYVIQVAWWINHQWCKYRGRPSWIDKQVIAAMDMQQKWAEFSKHYDLLMENHESNS